MQLTDFLIQSSDLIRKAAQQPGIADKVEQAVATAAKALGAGRPLLLCGNGGSASDAMHIVGELVGRFLKERKALNAICLSSNPAVLTAWSNDYSYETV
ncbi:MAG TPA: SIS domain-containing protein, partial [Alphaproteobacteria bacterium]|nr:SIS domain-containing protein [Alphaproteobacteria bacterium]